MNNQDSEKYETLYRELLKYSEETHERNKKRISAGIKCLIIKIICCRRRSAS